MTNLSHISRCSFWGIQWIPFGIHACQFYSSARHSALKRLDADWQVFALPKFLEMGLESQGDSHD
jgi:hypothetical protein